MSKPLAHGVCLCVCVAFAAAALVHLHDRTWNPYDDGTYLHVADRMLHGEVLHRDVQDMHPGYINFANAGAMRLFGNDAVSPRYPLIALGVVNAAVAYWLLAGAGIGYAVAASVSMTALSFVQFMNPTAHWYCLSVTLLLGAAMVRLPAGAPRTQLLLGLLVGLVVLFRQLTGVFAAMAVLLHVILSLPPAEPGRRAWLGKVLLVVTALGLAGYLLRKTDPVAFVMYGSIPTAVLLWAAWQARPADRAVAVSVVRLAAGGAIAALPLVAYAVYYGAVRAWLDDCVFGAMSITQLSFIDRHRFWQNMAGGAKAVVRHQGVPPVLSGLFWVVAPVLPVLLGVLVLKALWLGRKASPLALLGLLYFPVALHLQKYMYLFFALPLVVLGLLAMTPPLRRHVRCAVLGAVWMASAVAFVLFAAPVRAIVPGRNTPLVADHGIPRCGLLLEPSQAALYKNVLGLIDREVGPDESIFVAPVDPELYYLSGRRNPTRFYLTAIALRRPGDVAALLRQFERSPPRLVFYNPESNYVSPVSDEVMAWVRSHYDAMENRGGFEVYRSRARSGTE